MLQIQPEANPNTANEATAISGANASAQQFDTTLTAEMDAQGGTPSSTAANAENTRRSSETSGMGLLEKAQNFRDQAVLFRAQADAATGRTAESLDARADRADAAAERLEAAAMRSSGGTTAAAMNPDLMSMKTDPMSPEAVDVTPPVTTDTEAMAAGASNPDPTMTSADTATTTTTQARRPEDIFALAADPATTAEELNAAAKGLVDLVIAENGAAALPAFIDYVDQLIDQIELGNVPDAPEGSIAGLELFQQAMIERLQADQAASAPMNTIEPESSAPDDMANTKYVDTVAAQHDLRTNKPIEEQQPAGPAQTDMTAEKYEDAIDQPVEVMESQTPATAITTEASNYADSVRPNSELITMKAVDGAMSGYWTPTKIAGQDAIVYDAPTSNFERAGDKDSLSFDITPETSGMYQIYLNSARSSKAQNAAERGHKDQGNDVFLKITDETISKVVQDQTKLFTYFGDANDTFKIGDTFDHGNHKLSNAEIYLEAGHDYRFDLLGRSDGFAIKDLALQLDKKSSEISTMLG